jgi:hypothetical protein
MRPITVVLAGRSGPLPDVGFNAPGSCIASSTVKVNQPVVS